MNRANPTALLQSAVLMLRHLEEDAAADRVDNALRATIGAGQSTRDLGGSLGTREFADAIIARLGD